MRNGVDIAAVTVTLRNLIETGIQSTVDLEDTLVTGQHPGTGRGMLTSNQVNVFLYQVTSGAPLPNNAAGLPPLTLQLSFLITAYGRDNDEIFEHRLLDRVMDILHDQPVLIVNANQPPQVRVAWHPMPVEALADLWVALQSPYRVSATYQISI